MEAVMDGRLLYGCATRQRLRKCVVGHRALNYAVWFEFEKEFNDFDRRALMISGL